MKNNKLLMIIVLFVLVLSLSSCTKARSSLEQMAAPKVGEEIAIIKTDFGNIKMRLFPDVAPKAVENFKTLAQEGYFNGKTFYRVKKGELIMAVNSEEEGYSQSIYGAPFEDEFNENYGHFKGAVSMANRGPDTNQSTFFIVNGSSIDDGIIEVMRELGDDEGFSDELIDTYEKIGGYYEYDFKHTVFGQIFEGMDVVEELVNVELNEMQAPVEDIIIKEIEIVPYEE
ncbi:peptidylprolyl isomerase [Fusibacter bizertensis]